MEEEEEIEGRRIRRRRRKRRTRRNIERPGDRACVCRLSTFHVF